MKGDFTRDTFRPGKHYSAVRLQQGRVLLDAEWNEQVDIQQHASATTAADIIGGCGAVVNDRYDSFKIEAVNGAAPEFRVRGGHIYVEGAPVEYEDPKGVSLTGQPFMNPGPLIIRTDAADPGKPFTVAGAVGTYVAYLDVWQRHITALDDPALREIALGGSGPDTATRTQTIWQVFLQPAPGATCAGLGNGWAPGQSATTGKLSARARHQGDPADQCQVPAGGGYRRLENQLYRVEVHKSGDRDTATFKWSRDNGSITALIMDGDTNSLTVSNPGRDDVQSFAGGPLVEVTDDYHEWMGQPGTLVDLLKVEGDVLIIPVNSVKLSDYPAAANPKARRWDGTGKIELGTDAGSEGYLPLEDGVEIKFEPGYYKAGDYWLIPARTLLADVEFPQVLVAGAYQPVPQEPNGVRHHYCPLAIVRVDAAPTLTVVSDCRPIFPPLTRMTRFFYLGGDGQEALPGSALPQQLRVGVANGGVPVKGAVVRFEITSGGGTLQGKAEDGSPLAGNPILPKTDDKGVAWCTWTLEDEPAHLNQVVLATLLDDAGNPAGPPPIQFGATAQIALYAIGGDGQQVMPGSDLPQPLEVRVSHGGRLAEGHTVRFTDDNPNGRLATTAAGLPGPQTQVDVPVDAEGIGRCFWRPDFPAGSTAQQVHARLLVGASEVGSPVHFNAFPSTAALVAYTPGCVDLAGMTTVQAAIDALCKRPGGSGAGACITVGPQEQAQFKTIDEAIQKSLAQGLKEICICLLPGDHNSEGNLVYKTDGAVALSIAGCGRASRIQMRSGHLAFAGFAEVSFKDLVILAEGTQAGPAEPWGQPGVLSFDDCASVTLADCEMLAYAAQVALLTVGPGAQRITLERNVIRSYGPEQFDPVGGILGPGLANLAELLAEKDFDKFREGSASLAGNWVADAALRKAIVTALHAVEAAQNGVEPQGFVGTLSNLALLLAGERPLASRIVVALDQMRAAAAQKAPRTAVVFAEAEGQATLEDNEIGGIFSVSGDPALNAVGRLVAPPGAGGVGREVFDLISQSQYLPKGTGDTLHLRNNRITQMTLGSGVMTDLMKAAANFGHVEMNIKVPAYRLVSLTNNVFTNEMNAWFGQSIALASNLFPAADRPTLPDAVGGVSVVAICIAEGATYTGNQGRPGAPGTVLRDVTLDRAGASNDPNIRTNLFLTISQI